MLDKTASIPELQCHAAADGTDLHLMQCNVRTDIRSLCDNPMKLGKSLIEAAAAGQLSHHHQQTCSCQEMDECTSDGCLELVGTCPHATGAGRHQLAPPPPPGVPTLMQQVQADTSLPPPPGVPIKQ